MKWDIAWLIVFLIPTIILWLLIGIAEIPVTRLSSTLQSSSIMDSCDNCTQTLNQTVTYRVSFILYLISMLTFFGTFLLIVFGGIGLSALPMDLVNAWRKRPKPISVQAFATKRNEIGRRAAILLESAKKLQSRLNASGGRPRGRKDSGAFNKLRAQVYLLEESLKKLERARKMGTGVIAIISIVWDWIQLLLGLIGIGLSLLWLIHIFVFLVPPKGPISPFLNAMFEKLDVVFPLFGVIFYAIFSFYLLWCVIKGNFKFGLRIPLFCEIHPMKLHETLMNAFLFNAFILVLASFAIVEFCTYAFSYYGRNTSIDKIFNVGVTHLRYIKYFWAYYYWGIIVIAILAAVWLIINPSDRKSLEKDLRLDDLPRV